MGIKASLRPDEKRGCVACSRGGSAGIKATCKGYGLNFEHIARHPTAGRLLKCAAFPVLAFSLAVLVHGKHWAYPALLPGLCWIAFVLGSIPAPPKMSREMNRWIRADDTHLKVQVGVVTWHRVHYDRVLEIFAVWPEDCDPEDPQIWFASNKRINGVSARNIERNNAWGVLADKFPGLRLPAMEKAGQGDLAGTMALWKRQVRYARSWRNADEPSNLSRENQ